MGIKEPKPAVQSESPLRKRVRELLDKLNGVLISTNKSPWLEILEMVNNAPSKSEKKKRKEWRQAWKSKWITIALSLSEEPKKAEIKVIKFLSEQIVQPVTLRLIKGYGDRRNAEREDLRQESLKRLHEIMPELITAYDPVSLINRIVENRFKDIYRKHRRRRRTEVKEEKIIRAIMPEQLMIDLYRLVWSKCKRWAQKRYIHSENRIELEAKALYVTFKMLVKKFDKKYNRNDNKKIDDKRIARVLKRLHLSDSDDARNASRCREHLKKILKCREIRDWLEMPMLPRGPFVANDDLPEPSEPSILDSNLSVDRIMQKIAKEYGLTSSGIVSKEGI